MRASGVRSRVTEFLLMDEAPLDSGLPGSTFMRELFGMVWDAAVGADGRAIRRTSCRVRLFFYIGVVALRLS